MKQASTEAYAKINLTLDVTGKRPNGYHDVCMVMQSIGIHDIVTVQTETGADDIELTISHCDLPTDSSNLAYRAAQLFLQRTNKRPACGSTSKSTIRWLQVWRAAARMRRQYWYCSTTCIRRD